MNASAYINLTLLVTLLLATTVTCAEERSLLGGSVLGGILLGALRHEMLSSAKDILSAAALSATSTVNDILSSAASSARSSAESLARLLFESLVKSSGKSSPKSTAKTSVKPSHEAQPQNRMEASDLRQTTNATSAPPSYGDAGGLGAAHMPPGSTYYANTTAIPVGTIYYAEPPIQSTSGSGGFFFALMAGSVPFGHPLDVTHVSHQSQQSPAASSSDGKTIIIDDSGGTATVHQLRSGDSDSNSSTDTAPRYWPTDTRLPLNATVTPAEAIKPDTSTNINININSDIDSDKAAAQQAPAPPPGDIVCVPMVFNETDPSDPSKTHNVERVICFPAPPPPPPPALPPVPPAAAASSTAPQCALRTFVESDPNDPTKTIEVQKEYCSTAATTKQVQVAGEIGENNNAATEANKQPATTVTATLTSTSATASTPATPTTTGLSSTSDKPSEALTAS